MKHKIDFLNNIFCLYPPPDHYAKIEEDNSWLFNIKY